MKSAGYNAIRTSHNPPSPAFLDACDRLGILVMDEAFDHWQEQKNPQDYHRFFSDWWERDLASMVLRDRNHPSVILWSIGNEIIERDEPSGPVLARKLAAAVKAMDPTRPVTEALCSSWKGRPWTVMDPHFAVLDAGGYNYQWRQYDADHGRLPARVMVGTESYPMEAFDNWDQVLRRPYVIGDFVWTAYDYLGESGIGRAWIEGAEPGGFTGVWPWHIAGCGDIDLLGRRKPQSYYREALWPRGSCTSLCTGRSSRGRQRRSRSGAGPRFRATGPGPAARDRPSRWRSTPHVTRSACGSTTRTWESDPPSGHRGARPTLTYRMQQASSRPSAPWMAAGSNVCCGLQTSLLRSA